MKVVIHDRTEELAPRLRGYTQRRLEKLGRHFKPVLSAEERGKDLQAIVDLALEKVDRQVLKLKDKIVHRHRLGPAEDEPEPVSDTVTEGPERVITRVKAESVSQAMDALEANGYLFHLFLDEDNGDLNLIYRRADGTVSIIEPKIS